MKVHDKANDLLTAELPMVKTPKKKKKKSRKKGRSHYFEHILDEVDKYIKDWNLSASQSKVIKEVYSYFCKLLAYKNGKEKWSNISF